MAALLAAAPVSAAEGVVSGEPRIVDGDTVQYSSVVRRIRLAGIDAPKGEKWACGVASRDALVKFSAGRRPRDCDITVPTDTTVRSAIVSSTARTSVHGWSVRAGRCLLFDIHMLMTATRRPREKHR